MIVAKRFRKDLGYHFGARIPNCGVTERWIGGGTRGQDAFRYSN
jgi:hypothetical protein